MALSMPFPTRCSILENGFYDIHHRALNLRVVCQRLDDGCLARGLDRKAVSYKRCGMHKHASAGMRVESGVCKRAHLPAPLNKPSNGLSVKPAFACNYIGLHLFGRIVELKGHKSLTGARF